MIGKLFALLFRLLAKLFRRETVSDQGKDLGIDGESRYIFWDKSTYSSQRDNQYYPHSTCNTTSMVMALERAGYDLKLEGMTTTSSGHTYEQPEDYLTHRLMSEAATKLAMQRHPQLVVGGKLTVPPNQIHDILSIFTNNWVGAYYTVDRATHFSLNNYLPDLIREFWRGCGIVLTGEFPMGDRTLRHMVSVSGFVLTGSKPVGNGADNELLNRLEYLVINDPYGDYHTGYKDQHGEGVLMPREDVIRIFRESGSHHKWAHIVAPVDKTKIKVE